MRERLKQLRSRILWMLCLLLCFSGVFGVSAAHAAGALRIASNGKTETYTGAQVTYKWNGKTLNKPDYPGIIINGTSLASAYDVFAKSNIHATYQYSAKTGNIRISRGNQTIQMKLNSNKATVNGKSYTLNVAPRRMEFLDTKTVKIYVPARFVAENLGCTYVWNSRTSIATIETPLQIYYDGKWQDYTKTKGSVTFNGKKIAVENTLPSLMFQDTALLQANRVFTAIGCSYQYNSSKKTVTLSYNGTEIVFTMGSDIALVNGESYTMDTAARLIGSGLNNKKYCMIPGRFAAENLGFYYEWDEATSTSRITTEKPQTGTENNNNHNQNNGTGNSQSPELGGDEPVIREEKNYFNWNYEDGQKESIDYVSNLLPANGILSGVPIDPTHVSYTGITDIKKKESSSAYELYSIEANTEFHDIFTASPDEKSLSLTIPSSVAVTNIISFENSLVKQASLSHQETEMQTQIDFQFAQEYPKYELYLSEDKTTLYLKVYYNHLMNISAGYQEEQEIITLTGTSAFDALVYEDPSDPDLLYIDLDQILDTVTNRTYLSDDVFAIMSAVYVQTGEHSSRLMITKTEESSYKVESSGTQLIIRFKKNTDGSNSSSNPSEPQGIRMKKPDGITVNSIEVDDQYHQKRILLTLPGDFVNFYEENPIQNGSNTVTDVTVQLNEYGNTVITIQTNRVQGYQITEQEGDLFVRIADPKEIYSKIVVLDAGHGGSAPGAISSGYQEKELTYTMLYTYIKDYFKNSDIKAYWTRIDDTDVSLSNRAAFAEQVGADIFVSLHMDSFTTSVPNGTSVFYSNANNETLPNGLNSKIMASMFLENLLEGLDTNNRGVKASQYTVCHRNTVPAVLIELAFITNQEDLAKITNPTIQKKVSNILYDTIAEIFLKYPTGR